MDLLDTLIKEQSKDTQYLWGASAWTGDIRVKQYFKKEAAGFAQVADAFTRWPEGYQKV